MRSRVYHQGRYAAQQEMCLHHFHQLLSTAMQPHLAAWDAQRGHAVPNANGNSSTKGGHARQEVSR